MPAEPWALLVRGAALQRLRREREAGDAFREALAIVDSSFLQIFTNLARILPKTGSLRYEHVSRGRRAPTDQQFWRDADLLMLTPGNELQTEYYRRIVEAELRYTDRRFNRRHHVSRDP